MYSALMSMDQTWSSWPRRIRTAQHQTVIADEKRIKQTSAQIKEDGCVIKCVIMGDRSTDHPNNQKTDRQGMRVHRKVMYSPINYTTHQYLFTEIKMHILSTNIIIKDINNQIRG